MAIFCYNNNQGRGPNRKDLQADNSPSEGAGVGPAKTKRNLKKGIDKCQKYGIIKVQKEKELTKMKKLEVVMEMVANGYHLFEETPAQFAARFSLEQLKFMRDCFLGKYKFP